MGHGEAGAAAGVSAREAEVLAAVGEHLTNAEIAAKLFISIRTVESHVSSLLRKFGVSDRRALASIAEGDGAVSALPRITALPSALTSFIGRATERAALVETLHTQRLVTAVGPGGVGKTRLAVAADVAERFADGVWYVDLVPVTDPAMVGSVVAGALGLGEQHGRSAEDTVLGWAADRQALLVLDNCEHLLDGVVVLVERLLAQCPGLVVLATSRARLLVPFEQVFPLAGLSVLDEHQRGDAVVLFEERAAAAGSPLAPPTSRGSSGSAGASTACPWRSSSPLPGCQPSASTVWRPLWPIACTCSPAPSASMGGTGRCGPRWTGAAPCSIRRPGRCSAGCRCSQGPSAPLMRPPSQGGRRWRRAKWEPCWRRWPTTACSCSARPRTAAVTGPSRPFASTERSCSTTPANSSSATPGICAGSRTSARPCSPPTSTHRRGG